MSPFSNAKPPFPFRWVLPLTLSVLIFVVSGVCLASFFSEPDFMEGRWAYGLSVVPVHLALLCLGVCIFFWSLLAMVRRER